MAKIALLPIDNRPVCYQLPELIVNQAKEHSLYLPDINLLGDLNNIADIEKLFNWIENLKDIDIFIISLDTLAYGGLIPSRRSEDTFEIIIKRINRLTKLLKNNKVYAFSSIMRIPDNNFNEEEKEYWKYWGKKIFEYSYSIHKYGTVKTDIPPDILENYLNTRKRNFEINKYYIELKKQGFFDTLIFSKDDCAEFGLNIMEANELKELSNTTNNIFIKTGADEIPLTLLSRALNSEKKIKIFPYYLKPPSIDKISKYEDLSVKQSVESQIDISGGIVSDEKNCDIMLIVNNFEKEQGELVMNTKVPLFNDKLNLPLQPYFVADILNANGGDNNFVKELLSQNLKNFYGYAGWNTSGNTLGSVISGALTYFKAEIPNTTAFKELQAVRFLDDWAYQANVREKIRDNINNLNVETLTLYLKDYEKIILNKFELKKNINYYFPWHRFFEIGINIF